MSIVAERKRLVGEIRAGHIVAAAKVTIVLGLLGFTGYRALLARPALFEAEAAFARKDYQRALQLAQDDIQDHPRSRQSNLLVARSLSRLIYGDEAEPYYQQATKTGPLDLEVLQDRIQGLITSNRRDRAVAACHAVLEKFPDDPTTLKFLSAVEYSRNRRSQAIAAAERLAATKDGKAVGLAMLRDLYHAGDDYERAAKAGKQLLEADPGLTCLRYDKLGFWSEMANDLLLAGDAEQAKIYLQKVVETSPNALFLDLLGTSQYRLGELEDAEKSWRRAAAIDPRRINPHYRIGLIEMGRSHYDLAAESLEKAVAIDSTKLEPTYNLARLYRVMGRTKEADKLDRVVEELRLTVEPAHGGMGPSP